MRVDAKGVVLVETLVATLLAAVITSGVFMAILSSRQALAKSDVRTQATASAKQLLDLLGNFVTADPSAATVAYAPYNCWNFRDPNDAGGVCLPGWALADGNHDATFLLPAELQGNFSAAMSYVVTTRADGTKSVAVSLAWVEPQ